MKRHETHTLQWQHKNSTHNNTVEKKRIIIVDENKK